MARWRGMDGGKSFSSQGNGIRFCIRILLWKPMWSSFLTIWTRHWKREGHDWCQDDSHRVFCSKRWCWSFESHQPSPWAKAERIKATLSPGRAHICAETASLAITFKQIFRDSMYLGHPWTICIAHPCAIIIVCHSNTSPPVSIYYTYSTPVWRDFFSHLALIFAERSAPCEVERSLSLSFGDRRPLHPRGFYQPQ